MKAIETRYHGPTTVTVEYDHYYPRQPILITFNQDKGRTQAQAQRLAAFLRRALADYQETEQ